jgi:3-dehydroquinate dehydratase-2
MPERPRVLVLHGPNLGSLGTREPEVYGCETLADIDASLSVLGELLGLRIETDQFNGEGQLIDRIHAFAAITPTAAITAAQAQRTVSGPSADPQPLRPVARGLVVNPAGYTHTSVALRDAIAAVGLPTIEVHLSNLYAREGFRHTSITGGACRGVIMGLGSESYRLALHALANLLTPPPA